jgi:hypothetical protein
MIIKWKKNADGLYESNVQYWDKKAMEYRPIYLISTRGYHGSKQLIVKGEIEKTFYGSGNLTVVKNAAQKIEDSKPEYLTDEDRAMSLPNAHIGMGAVSITAEGKGVHWYVDKNGRIVEA